MMRGPPSGCTADATHIKRLSLRLTRACAWLGSAPARSPAARQPAARPATHQQREALLLVLGLADRLVAAPDRLVLRPEREGAREAGKQVGNKPRLAPMLRSIPPEQDQPRQVPTHLPLPEHQPAAGEPGEGRGQLAPVILGGRGRQVEPLGRRLRQRPGRQAGGAAGRRLGCCIHEAACKHGRAGGRGRCAAGTSGRSPAQGCPAHAPHACTPQEKACLWRQAHHDLRLALLGALAPHKVQHLRARGMERSGHGAVRPAGGGKGSRNMGRHDGEPSGHAATQGPAARPATPQSKAGLPSTQGMPARCR